MLNLELIRWIDSIRHLDGWNTVEYYERESKKSLECETAGWAIHETDDSVMVAQSRMVEGGAVTEVIQIPKIAIVERTSLANTVKRPPRDPVKKKT